MKLTAAYTEHVVRVVTRALERVESLDTTSSHALCCIDALKIALTHALEGHRRLSLRNVHVAACSLSNYSSFSTDDVAKRRVACDIRDELTRGCYARRWLEGELRRLVRPTIWKLGEGTP